METLLCFCALVLVTFAICGTSIFLAKTEKSKPKTMNLAEDWHSCEELAQKCQLQEDEMRQKVIALLQRPEGASAKEISCVWTKNTTQYISARLSTAFREGKLLRKRDADGVIRFKLVQEKNEEGKKVEALISKLSL